MKRKDAKVGVWVRSLRDFSGVPKGTIGIIDEDYGRGVMVAWDLKGTTRELPPNYDVDSWKQLPIGKRPNILRDGFSWDELEMLEVI